jgi:hypothetical protein
MKRTALTLSCLAAIVLCAGGCSSSQSTLQTNEPALAMVGPYIDAAGPQQPGIFRLGAGDALGQAIFANYVAYVRANNNTQYAGAETTE